MLKGFCFSLRELFSVSVDSKSSLLGRNFGRVSLYAVRHRDAKEGGGVSLGCQLVSQTLHPEASDHLLGRPARQTVLVNYGGYMNVDTRCQKMTMVYRKCCLFGLCSQ
uniref:Uncharacterized protein n=1 Tax=Pyxicephalus adspersus TaxID=30357 RepID=A0AAV3A6J6_PYXAD|nr:TPA: hypothetical protein GDO54_017970 [Pyxicephalus adspersus]